MLCNFTKTNKEILLLSVSNSLMEQFFHVAICFHQTSNNSPKTEQKGTRRTDPELPRVSRLGLVVRRSAGKQVRLPASAHLSRQHCDLRTLSRDFKMVHIAAHLNAESILVVTV